MKSKIAWMLLPISLFVVLAGTYAYGQSSTRMKVNIPFDFRVGSQSLPAGEYTVVPKSPTMVVIQSKEHHQSAAALSNAVQANQSPANGKLIFNRYGALYFLSQIWTPGEEVGRKLPKSGVEQEVAGGTSPSETIVLTAQKVDK
jgi:hypothetical protein